MAQELLTLRVAALGSHLIRAGLEVDTCLDADTSSLDWLRFSSERLRWRVARVMSDVRIGVLIVAPIDRPIDRLTGKKTAGR
jgi:hypothetical protein